MIHRGVNRRQLLNAAGAGLLWAGSRPLWAQTLAAGAADAVVVNARIYTVEPAAPRAQACAIKDGRFIAVGSNARVRALIGKGTQVFDAQQMTVVPGFIDCHNHAVGLEVLYETSVGNPFEVEFVTIAGIVEKLRAKARTTPPGYWVEGHFFDDTKVKDGRTLNVNDLDSVSRDLPVAVHHRGGHTSFYNSKALQLAGVSRDTPDPPGGTFDRDANGNLTGRVTDKATAVFENVGLRPTYTPEQRAERQRAAMGYMSEQFARYGLTSVHHEHFDGPHELRAI